MACIRRRRGRYVVDYKKPNSKRGWKSFETQEGAEAYLSERLRESSRGGGKTVSRIDSKVTLLQYSEHYLAIAKRTLRPNSYNSYKSVLNHHIIPALGAIRVTSIWKTDVRAFLMGMFAKGYALSTVKTPHHVLQRIFASAEADGLILTNPAAHALDGVGKKRMGESEVVLSLTRAELGAFLEAARTTEPHYYPILLLMARTGLRIGEAVAIRWDDVDFTARRLRVAGTRSHSRYGPTKSGRIRIVDFPPTVGDVLKRLEKSELRLRSGGSPYVFLTRTGRAAMDTQEVQMAFKRAGKVAQISPHFTPHSLRHTYARLMLENHSEILYVQRQMGHTNINMTVDRYGHWAVIDGRGAVDKLDEDVAEDVAKLAKLQVGQQLSAYDRRLPEPVERQPNKATPDNSNEVDGSRSVSTGRNVAKCSSKKPP